MILFAAGNSNRPVNDTVNEQGWPNNILSGPTAWLDGFAANEFVMAISACTSLNTKSAYSSWGNEISVCAPSNNGHPNLGNTLTYPQIRGSFPGRGIVTTDRVGVNGYSQSDYTGDFGGTSSACPLVAGVAALVISANPDLTGLEVREILEQTADKITDPSTDPQLGLSLGTYDENGHSQWFGFGKVNAFQAVQEAIRRKNGTIPPTETNTLSRSSAPNLSIPDNATAGIEDTISIEESGILTGIEVAIDISHTYIGDLVVRLVSPRGSNIILHNRNGGSANNLVQTYTMSTLSGLAVVLEEEIQGNWRLRIQDLAGADVGQLNRWDLTLTLEGTSPPAEEPEGPVVLSEAPVRESQIIPLLA